HGIPLNCLERLITLRPDMAGFWSGVVHCQSASVVKSIESESGCFYTINQNAYGAYYLATAHRLMPNAGYDVRSRRCLESCMCRKVFYHIKRGTRMADLDERVAGDDYRNMFMAETHAMCLAAYWHLVPQKMSTQIKLNR
ncbi:MAG: hypothetical protein WCS96_06025, partial [Victivallales bacterium]